MKRVGRYNLHNLANLIQVARRKLDTQKHSLAHSENKGGKSVHCFKKNQSTMMGMKGNKCLVKKKNKCKKNSQQ